MKRNANYLTQRIIDACAHGATLPEIHARVGRSDPTVCVIVGQLVAARRLFKAGSKMTQTYFADVAEAKACSEELERIKAQLDAEDASQKAARRKPKEPQKTPKSGSRRAELSRLRVLKGELELSLIRKASDATCKAHVAAMRALKPGINERVIQDLVEATFKKERCPEL